MRNDDSVSGIGRLIRRADFVRAGTGQRWHGKSVSVQAVARPGGEFTGARVGFTLTKKVGCAVVRNRARRRLREVVRLSDIGARPGHDYVFIGRLDAIRTPFDELRDEMSRAIRKVHDTRASSRQSGGAGARKPRAKP